VEPDEYALLEAALRHALRDFRGPVAIGLRCGHVDVPNVTLPLGVRARLEADAENGAQLMFLESATRPEQ
jgi:muramoyltetrapeptide carboxypeptidase